MEDISFSALIAVVWVGISQLFLLLYRKERDLKLFLSVFSLAFISYFLYGIVNEVIFPSIFHFFEIFKEGNINKLGTEGLRTSSEPTKIVFFISIDVITKFLLKFNFFNLFQSKESSYTFITEALNYVLMFTAFTFLISLLMIVVFLIWTFYIIKVAY